MHSLPALTRSQLQDVDRRALQVLGLPGVVLMENAGRGAAEAVLRTCETSGGRAVILCGRGNNGGDGYVLARHLELAGVAVALLETSVPEELTPDAAVFREVARGLGLELLAAHDVPALERCMESLGAPRLLVDALLGTGFRGTLRARESGLLGALGAWCSKTQTPVVALDLPSGMDADDGSCAEQTLRCARTLTFGAPKVGFEAPGARAYTGAIEVVSLGLPSRFVLGGL